MRDGASERIAETTEWSKPGPRRKNRRGATTDSRPLRQARSRPRLTVRV